MHQHVDALEEIGPRVVRAPLALAGFGAAAYELCGQRAAHAAARAGDGDGQRLVAELAFAQAVFKGNILDELVLPVGE